MPSHQLLAFVVAVLLVVAAPLVAIPSALASATSAEAASHKHRTHKRPGHKHGDHRRHAGHAKRAHHKRVVKVKIRGGRGSGASLPNGGYPSKWNDIPMDSVYDNWGMSNRNCTSFVAFALADRYGFNMPFFDHARFWGPRLAKLGYTVNDNPEIGAIAWSDRGYYGHVALVSGLDADGNVLIEQYNADNRGHYSTEHVPRSSFRYIHVVPAPAVAPAPSQPIQGSSPPIQGSSPPVQGSNQPVQGTPSGGGSGGGGPTFGVMKTSETPPDGVWFRNSPAQGDTDRVTGHGVYMNETIQAHCWAWGDAVGAYENRIWYRATNVSRPTNAGVANVGYLNTHYVNDGMTANHAAPGVPAC